jgi:hypothetical protein
MTMRQPKSPGYRIELKDRAPFHVRVTPDGITPGMRRATTGTGADKVEAHGGEDWIAVQALALLLSELYNAPISAVTEPDAFDMAEAVDEAVASTRRDCANVVASVTRELTSREGADHRSRGTAIMALRGLEGFVLGGKIDLARTAARKTADLIDAAVLDGAHGNAPLPPDCGPTTFPRGTRHK